MAPLEVRDRAARPQKCLSQGFPRSDLPRKWRRILHNALKCATADAANFAFKSNPEIVHA
jgi:hypothetical protein